MSNLHNQPQTDSNNDDADGAPAEKRRRVEATTAANQLSCAIREQAKFQLSTRPKRPLIALWYALINEEISAEVITAMVLDPGCGLERITSRADKLILDEGKRVYEGSTPLILATFAQRVDVMSSLIAEGANLAARCIWGNTAIHIAAEVGGLEALVLLISKSSDLLSREDGEGKTSIHGAAEYGHASCIQLLVANGVEVDSPDEKGRTQLHYAARSGHLECIELLLDSGARVNSIDKYGRTPLSEAVFGNRRSARLLISSGATVDLADNDGRTPLARAAQMGYTDCIPLLISAGANVSALDKSESSVLQLAAGGRGINVDLLLRNGADVNCYGLKASALHLSASDGSLSCCELLLACGAEINGRYMNGMTSLHLACGFNQEDGAGEGLITQLLAEGADANATDNVGKTPLDYAGNIGVELLQRHTLKANHHK